MHDQEADVKFTKDLIKNTKMQMTVVRGSRNPQRLAGADVRQIAKQAGSKPGIQTDRQRHQLETGRTWSMRQAGSYTVGQVIRLRHM